MKNKTTQLIYGLPILAFALASIMLDSAGFINVDKFGYAFFGGIVLHFLYYFFRKTPPADANGDATTVVQPVGFHTDRA